MSSKSNRLAPEHAKNTKISRLHGLCGLIRASALVRGLGEEPAPLSCFLSGFGGDGDILVKLSDEQAEQMSSIFASLKPGFGGPGITEYSNAREQLEIRLRAFASVLTPEQLQNYRRLKMEDIEQHEQIPRIIKALKQ